MPELLFFVYSWLPFISSRKMDCKYKGSVFNAKNINVNLVSPIVRETRIVLQDLLPAVIILLFDNPILDYSPKDSILKSDF